MARTAPFYADIAIICILLTAHCFAIQSANFGFNAQVPTVARVGQPYFFQFTASTFAPIDAKFTYSLANQPAWLVLDGATRTLSGVPGASNAGSSIFALIAAGEMGPVSMPCTLVVSTDPVPLLQGDLSDQLTGETNLSSPTPAAITLVPGQAFEFHFRQDSFIDIVQRKLFYYATLTDHTPLPGWLHFDAESLTFSGNTPQLSAFPQSWQIALIASDVEGFAGSSSSFTIVIDLEQLVFSPQEHDVQVTPGSSVQISSLLSTLSLNGKSLKLSDLAKAQVSGLPDWLSFNNSTLVFSGTAPGDFVSQNITVTVSDSVGDSAAVSLRLNAQSASTSLFNGTIGTLNATAGEHFQYAIPDTIIDVHGVSLGIIIPPNATWLDFDQEARLLKGDIPTETTSSTIVATLTARAPNVSEPQRQVFNIKIQAAASTYDPTTTLVIPTSEPTSSLGSTPGLAAETADSHHRLRSSAIAGIIAGSILALILMLALFCCCYRQKRPEGYDRHFRPSKRDISRPIVPSEADNITVTTELQRDVEKTGGSRVEAQSSVDGVELSPQIEFNLPRHSTRMSRWTNKFSRTSLASSIGNGEDAIRGNNDIPQWGEESAVLNRPHDSFSVPAEMARMSRQLSQNESPSRRALWRKRARRNLRESEESATPGAGISESTLDPRQSSRRERSQKKSRGSAALSPTMDRSSCVSLSTKGTSIMAETFARSPSSSVFTCRRSNPYLSVAETEKRKSVRLIRRNNSTADGWSFQDKRQSLQSFVKHMRRSASRHSTLWSNKLNGHMSDAGMLGSAKLKRSGKDESSYSKSSSVQPTRQSNRFSQRIRSTFAPDYPRVIPNNNENDAEWEDASSDEDLEAIHEYRSDEIENLDWRAELARPKHQREWRHPGEDLTPPPKVIVPPPNSRYPSSHRTSTPGSEFSANQRLRERLGRPMRSSSPLTTTATISAMKERTSLTSAAKASPVRPVYDDDPDKPKPERPRLYQTNSGRLVSVDKVERLSRFKAQREDMGDTVAGSEPWEEERRAVSPLILRNDCGGSVRVGTGRSGMSAMSGPAFI